MSSPHGSWFPPKPVIQGRIRQMPYYPLWSGLRNDTSLLLPNSVYHTEQPSCSMGGDCTRTWISRGKNCLGPSLRLAAPMLELVLEVLAVERSCSYIRKRRTVLLSQGRFSSVGTGCPLWLSVQLQDGCMCGVVKGGRGHLPRQPGQLNQPWPPLGWWMFQPDSPHILAAPIYKTIALIAVKWFPPPCP